MTSTNFGDICRHYAPILRGCKIALARACCRAALDLQGETYDVRISYWRNQKCQELEVFLHLGSD